MYTCPVRCNAAELACWTFTTRSVVFVVTDTSPTNTLSSSVTYVAAVFRFTTSWKYKINDDTTVYRNWNLQCAILNLTLTCEMPIIKSTCLNGKRRCNCSHHDGHSNENAKNWRRTFRKSLNSQHRWTNLTKLQYVFGRHGLCPSLSKRLSFPHTHV